MIIYTYMPAKLFAASCLENTRCIRIWNQNISNLKIIPIVFSSSKYFQNKISKIMKIMKKLKILESQQILSDLPGEVLTSKTILKFQILQF